MKNIDIVNYLSSVCDKSGVWAYECEIKTEQAGDQSNNFFDGGTIICQGLEAQKLFESMRDLSAMFCKMYIKNIAENLKDHDLPNGNIKSIYHKERIVAEMIKSFV